MLSPMLMLRLTAIPISRRQKAVAGLFVGMVILGCTSEVGTSCEPLVAGVQVVDAQAPAPLQFGTESVWTELWRAGGQREGQELLMPVSLAVGLDGTVAIPDFGLGEVVVVGADGTWRGPVFRKGPGPEELQTPVAATWSSDGDLWVFDVVSPKILRYRGPDQPVSSVLVSAVFTAPVVSSGELVWAGVQPGGAVLLYPGWQSSPDAADPSLYRATLQRMSRTGGPIDTVASVAFPTVSAGRLHAWPVPGWARLVVALGAKGQFAVGGLDGTYRIVVYDSTGAAVRQICRQAAALALRPSERGEFDVEGLEELAAAIRAAPRSPTLAPYGYLVLGADGSLWVQRERSAAYPGESPSLYGRPGAHYDVFDPGGAYRGSTTIPEGGSLVGALGDTIWTFVRGSLDEIELVAYERANR